MTVRLRISPTRTGSRASWRAGRDPAGTGHSGPGALWVQSIKSQYLANIARGNQPAVKQKTVRILCAAPTLTGLAAVTYCIRGGISMIEGTQELQGLLVTLGKICC